MVVFFCVCVFLGLVLFNVRFDLFFMICMVGFVGFVVSVIKLARNSVSAFRVDAKDVAFFVFTRMCVVGVIFVFSSVVLLF